MATHLESQRIADQLDRAINGPAWHGPSVLQAIDDLPASKATARPIREAHTIRELVDHAAAWLEIARQRVEGTAPGSITDEMDWPPAGGADDETAWRAAVARLRNAAGRLEQTIRGLDDRRLRDEMPGEAVAWSVHDLLHGVIQHSLYHAGQIVLLKKGAS